MPTKQQPAPNNASVVASDELLKELEHVLELVQTVISEHSSSTDCLALIRMVEGLSLETWQKISSQIDDSFWLALPVKKSAATSLQNIQYMLEELFYQRDHDILTGLVNRRFFENQLSMEVGRAARSKTDISIIMVDIDDFKLVNDKYGHPCGDMVLARLGDVLKKSLRAYDIAARIGGEEFCLILPETSFRRAKILTRRILAEFRKEQFTAPDGSLFSVTFSAGIATQFGHGPAIKEADLLTQADNALYQAKAEGKNRVIISKESLRTSENPTLVQQQEKQFLFNGGG